MAGNALGTSYVQVVPKFKDGSLVDMGREVGSSFESGFGDALKKVAKILATSAIVKGIYDIGRAAVDSYAEYEQLVGGVETLYGAGGKSLEQYAESMGQTTEQARAAYDALTASQDAVLQNAQNAFRTAGLSANEYMSQATSFAAALVNSLGGDTAEAARLADIAITDMSDNANKMGTDMASIQNAYQGFAKQNYTMLDNLKLGYGGTKTEMERLLANAEAISGIHYDIENYSDVVSAIHVIQEEMGIAGTTALEAATTISGSWGMLKGSWQNLLTSLAGGGDEISVSMQNVIESLFTWLGNILPRIGETVQGMFEAIPAAAEAILPKARDSIMGFIRDTFGSDAADVVLDFVNMLHGAFDRMAEFGAGVIEALSPLTEFFSGQGEAFSGMMERIQGHLADLAPVVDELSATWDVLKETFTAFVEAVAPLVTEFIAQLVSGFVGLLPIFASFVEAVLTIVNDVLAIITAFVTDAQNGFEGLRSTLSTIWEAIKTAATTAWEGVKTAVINVWNGIKTGVSDAVNNVKTTVSNVFSSIKSTVSTVWNGIKSAITTPINAARDAVKTAIDRIKGFFNFRISWPHIPLPHFSVSGSANPLDWLTGGLPKFSISWYARGGFIDQPTVLAGVGERGGEFVWPSYSPYLERYADALAGAMGGGNTSYYIDGSAVAADAQLAAALEVVAQRVSGRQRMGSVRA